MCCYTKLNAFIERDSLLSPGMDECIDSLGDATIFRTLDETSSYCQAGIPCLDEVKTVFTLHNVLFKFISMQFGLKNAAGTCQRAMEVILYTINWQLALV